MNDKLSVIPKVRYSYLTNSSLINFVYLGLKYDMELFRSARQVTALINVMRIYSEKKINN